MTVNTNETRKTYNGNGVTTAFATPQFLADADLIVYVDGVLQTITTHYTVAGAGIPAGGTVTFGTAPPVGTSNVVIIRDPALTQLLDLVENDANPAETREAAFDKLTMIAQRLAEYVSRVVRLSDVDVTADLMLPLAADRASKYLAFDASGDVIASAVAIGTTPVTAFAGTILDDTTAGEVLTTLGISAFVQTTLDDADAGEFKDTLLLDATTTHEFTADAAYTLTAAQEQYGRIVFTDSPATLTGATVVNVSTAQRSRWYQNDTAQTLTIKTSAGTGITLAAGTSRPLVSDGTNVVDPLSAYLLEANIPDEIPELEVNLAGNAMTITLNPCALDFRSATLGSGVVDRVVLSAPISLTISSGSTLGTANAIQSDILVRVMNNGGTLELAADNLAGGNQADETNLITTTAEGGVGGADSATTTYSTTARTNLPYRVVGVITSTQATAGTWATNPSKIQGAGGNALTALQSLGYGQTYQAVTRAVGTTYYNTTGKPIIISIQGVGDGTANSHLQGVVNGVTVFISSNAGATVAQGLSFLVPAGASYSWAKSAGVLNSPTVYELR